MLNVPFLHARPSDYVTLMMFDRPGVAGWVLSADNSIGAAYSAPTEVLRVNRTAGYRSRFLRDRGLALGHSQRFGQNNTPIHVRWDDVWSPGGTLPHNSQPAYVRTREVYEDGTEGAWGPILVVPPPRFFSTSRPYLAFKGPAPNVTLPDDDLPPQDALHIILPRYCSWVTLYTSASIPDVGMKVSFRRDMPMLSASGGSEFRYQDGSVNELLILGDQDGVEFEFRAEAVNGASL